MQKTVVSMVVVLFACGVSFGAIVPGAELHLNANDTGSWYGGPEFGLSNDDYGTLPDSDAWWNLNTSGGYGHTLGTITDGSGNNTPESQPGAYLGTNGSSLDFNTRRSFNPVFAAGSGGFDDPSFFNGYIQSRVLGSTMTLTKAPDRTSDVTWEMWFRPATSKAFDSSIGSPSPYLMANEDYAGGSGFGLFEQASLAGERMVAWRAMQGSYGAASTLTANLPGDIASDWYHVVGTVSSTGEQAIYLNGLLVDSTTGVGASASVAGDVIGIRYRPSDPRMSDADVSIVRIYHDVLDADQVEQNFNTDAAMFGYEPIPEPATMVLLALGAAFGVWRRK